MSMKSFNDVDKIKEKFKSLVIEKNEQEGIDHDAYMLMAGYLSEIEKIQEDEGIKRNHLANQIKTSASYLTQVFRGDKPLNFQTLAKIQRVLKIKFQVRAYSINQNSMYSFDAKITYHTKISAYSQEGGLKKYKTPLYLIQGGYYNLKDSTKTA